uniref:Putative dna demethylase alkbh1 n=1 Tax=Culex tarsalis TaxID=7177 RepID=A0A1Q3FXQ8_CULTA
MFQEAFKYYKARDPPPSFENVIHTDKDDAEIECRLKNCKPAAEQNLTFPGLIDSSSWRIFELKKRPGLIIIKNPFTKHAQRHWMTRCICDYPKHPNQTNLPDAVIDKYYSRSDDKRAQFDWWSTALTIEDPTDRKKLLKALRWTTLGYHYDWTNKIYDESARNAFPDDLTALCLHFAQVLGYGQFRPEAAIVNYYPVGSTLAGHTDHSEKNLEAPLFSFSFGQPAIFLIGGHTKDEQPDALLLRSGDVIVMTREARLCYHAVPKVFHCSESERRQRWESTDADGVGTDQPEVQTATIASTVWADCRSTTSAFTDYISNSRININIRQVLNEGENHL